LGVVGGHAHRAAERAHPTAGTRDRPRTSRSKTPSGHRHRRGIRRSGTVVLVSSLMVVMAAVGACAAPRSASTPAEACRIDDRGVTVSNLPAVVTIEGETATTVLLAGAAEEGAAWLLPCVVDQANGGYVAVSFGLAKVPPRGGAVLTIDTAIAVAPMVLGDDQPMTAVAGQVEVGATSVEFLLQDGSKAVAVAENGFFLAVWPGTTATKEVRPLDAAGVAVPGLVEDRRTQRP